MRVAMQTRLQSTLQTQTERRELEQFQRAEFWGYFGLTIPLHRVGMNHDVKEAIRFGFYELPEIRGLQRAVRPGDRIIELGTGLGIITALAARATGDEGRVLSFEANAEMIDPTREFLAKHEIGNVEVRHAVLVPDAAPGEMREFHLAGSFAESSLLGAEGRGARGMVQVPALRIADVFAEFRPDVLLCDIEGGEAEFVPVLDASGLRAAVIEFHPDRLSRREVAAIYDSLARQGLYPEPDTVGGTVVLFTRITD